MEAHLEAPDRSTSQDQCPSQRAGRGFEADGRQVVGGRSTRADFTRERSLVRNQPRPLKKSPATGRVLCAEGPWSCARWRGPTGLVPTDEPAATLEITLSPRRQRAVRGKPVAIQVAVTNTGSKTARQVAIEVLPDDDFSLRGPDRRRLPDLPGGRTVTRTLHFTSHVLGRQAIPIYVFRTKGGPEVEAVLYTTRRP